MPKFDKEKKEWEFSEEEQGEIEMGARVRLRADDLREERKKKAEAEKLCPKCGEEKHDGECKKKDDKRKRRSFLG